MSLKVFGFVDGENIVLRYEDMLKNGAIPRPGVEHVPGLFVWHPDITRHFLCSFARIGFYQTVVGAPDAINEARAMVCDVRYTYQEDASMHGSGSLYPRLFKKQKKGTKTKSVDINISVDILRTVMNRTGDVIFLLSGDGDYMPLIEEVTRHGKTVWLGAFSKGLSQDLRYTADDYINLDAIFFEPTPPAASPVQPVPNPAASTT